MLKRKVSAIWVLILAVITAFACAFAAVTYIRCNRHMSTPKAKEIGNFCFLNAESDAEGVSFEIINAREVGSDVVLDLRWVNRSGKPIEYGEAYELYRLKGGKWEKIETELNFTAIAYCINSGAVGRISYTIPAHVDMISGERYRLQTEFRFQYGDEYSEPLKNRLEFEVVKATEYIMKESYTYRSKQDSATLCLDPDNKTFSFSLCSAPIGRTADTPRRTGTLYAKPMMKRKIPTPSAERTIRWSLNPDVHHKSPCTDMDRPIKLLTAVFRTAQCFVRGCSTPKPTFRPFGSSSRRTQKSKTTNFSRKRANDKYKCLRSRNRGGNQSARSRHFSAVRSCAAV